MTGVDALLTPIKPDRRLPPKLDTRVETFEPLPMHRLLLLLPAFASLLLAAHFYRAGSVALTALSLALLALLAIPRPWAARTLQFALVIGAVEWLHTLASFAGQRVALGQPYLRLTLILLAVAAFTAACALVFQHPSLRAWYRLGRPAGVGFSERETSRPV